jgi:hypothetical protein
LCFNKGDLNARTGTHALDFIPADNTINKIPIFENFSPDINLYTRHSEDSVLSTRGRTLNELCIHTIRSIIDLMTSSQHYRDLAVIRQLP